MNAGVLVRASHWIFFALLLCAAPSFVVAQVDKSRAPVPLGLPSDQLAPKANSRLIALGKQIFFDKSLSADKQVSCASCHSPEHGFSDPNPLSHGAFGQSGERHAPSIFNAAFNASQFWDGRSPSLEEQALQPFTTAKEYGLKDVNALLALLKASVAYRTQFKNIFPKEKEIITASGVAQAISAFERTLLSGNSAFDRYTFGRDSDALTAAQKRGLETFKGAARCATCHLIEMNHALFTDGKFHSSSIGMERLGDRLPSVVEHVLASRNRDPASIASLILSDSDIAALGRFVVTKDPKDIGEFKTPSLRNVAVVGPYMHDGSVPTLEQAVDLETYQRTDTNGRPIILTATERLELLDFLTTLTGSNLTKAPRSAASTRALIPATPPSY